MSSPIAPYSTRPNAVMQVEDVGKRFGTVESYSWLFRHISFRLETGLALALTGPNGTGKSTLLQILWSFKTPSEGRVELQVDGKRMDKATYPFACTFAAPYLHLPEALTGYQIARLHYGSRRCRTGLEELFETMGLAEAASRPFRQYSSGQRQRLRLGLALFDQAPVLLLDEPCSNLDAQGQALYHRLIAELAPQRLILIASNDPTEYESLGARVQIIGNQK